MTFSIYAATVPVYVRLLTNLSATLDKAAAYAEAKKVKPEVLLTARLYPDMWSLTEQVRASTSHPIRGVSRLAGLPIPTFDGKDESFEDLKARLAWTIRYLQSIDPKTMDGAEERSITFPAGDRQITMSGQDYLLTFSLPNFYFHLTAAYAILRHNGVPLIKDDFMGKA